MRNFAQGSYRRLRIESLEDRRMLALDPTGQEQEMLEAINRMRMNPSAELSVISAKNDSNVTAAMQQFGLTYAGLQAAFSALIPVAPLAMSEQLSNSAAAHDAVMIQLNTQGHQLGTEGDIGQRATNAGYSNYTTLGENVFAYAKSVHYAHAGFAIDWGNNPPGHRTNIMSSAWQEVGIDITATANPNPPFGDVGPLVVTQDFGARFDYGNPQLLGVVYTDTNGDTRYNNGEGRGGVTITATPVAGGASFTTTTMTAGGYQMHVPQGTYNVTASGGSLTAPITFSNIVVSSSNRKVDFVTNVSPNGAPVNTVPGAQTTVTNAALTFSVAAGNAISISDPDASSRTVQVTLSVNAGVLSLSGTNGLSFSAGDGVSDATMTFNGTIAAINTALTGLRFTAPATPAAATLTITTNDLGNTGSGGPMSDTDSVSITVTLPPNAPPVNAVPAMQVTQTNLPLTFSASRGNLISVADPDAASAAVRVTVSVNNGVFSLGQTANLSFSAGDGVGDATMTFDGTLAAVNAGLANLVFTPTTNFMGTSTLTVLTNDLGNTGLGGAKTDTDSVNIIIADPFVVAGNTLTLTGTGDADNVSIQFTSATAFNVIMGGVTNSYDTSVVSNVRYNLGASTDTVNVALPSNNNKNMVLMPSSLSITGPNYTIIGTGGNTQNVFANGGTGAAQFFDSPGNDVFYGLGTSASLNGPGYANQVLGMPNYYAFSSQGGTDNAVLFDLPGTDYFYGLQSYSVMLGGGVLTEPIGFRNTYANSTRGGGDIALIYDTPASDAYYMYPTYSVILGQNYVAQATGFSAMYAMALFGGTDTALMFDSAGADTFTGTSNLSIMIGTGYANVAYLVDYIHVYGLSGGDNFAYLYDSAGNDFLTGIASQVSIYYPIAAAIFVNNFARVQAISSLGGSDTRTNPALNIALTTTGNWLS